MSIKRRQVLTGSAAGVVSLTSGLAAPAIAQSDPISGADVPVAFAAGLVSFVSPCVLPLVPGYLAAVTGVNVGEIEEAGWRRVLVPSLLFIASFSVARPWNAGTA